MASNGDEIEMVAGWDETKSKQVAINARLGRNWEVRKWGIAGGTSFSVKSH